MASRESFAWREGIARVERRISTRARRWRVCVRGPSSIELVLPASMAAERTEPLLESVRPWLVNALEAEGRRPRLGLGDGAWLHGQPIGGNPGELWYRSAARDAVGGAVGRVAQRAGQHPARIRIGDPRTRWGSCSSRRTLSFSWRLVVAPTRVLDYVVAHEVCHLVHPHHRRTFWRLVDELHPSWREDAGWLKTYGRELRDWIPPGDRPHIAGQVVAARTPPVRSAKTSTGTMTMAAPTLSHP